MINKYISIAEYAKIKGVSTSAVYKRLKTTLQPYCAIVDNGKKALKREILEVENIGSVNINPSITSTTPQPVENHSSTTPQPLYIDELLKEKDKQIDELKEELAAIRKQCEEKDKFIMENAQKMILILEQSQELQRNNQILMAREQETKNIENSSKINIFTKLFKRQNNNK